MYIFIVYFALIIYGGFAVDDGALLAGLDACNHGGDPSTCTVDAAATASPTTSPPSSAPTAAPSPPKARAHVQIAADSISKYSSYFANLVQGLLTSGGGLIPLHLKDPKPVSVLGGLFKLSFTNLTLADAQLSKLTLALSPGKGLALSVSGVQIGLNYSLGIERLDGILKPLHLDGQHASASKTTVATVAAVQQNATEPARPALALDGFQVTIGKLDLELEGKVPKIFQGALKDFQEVFPKYIPDHIATELIKLVPGLLQGLAQRFVAGKVPRYVNFHAPDSPLMEATIDLGLAGPVVYDATLGLVVPLFGDTFNGTAQRPAGGECPLAVTRTVVQKPGRDVQVYLAPSFFSCAFAVFGQPDVVAHYLDRLLETLHFEQKMELRTVKSDGHNSLSLNYNQVSAKVELGLGVDRLYGGGKKTYLDFMFNVSTSAHWQLNQASAGAPLTVTLDVDTDAQVSFDVSAVSPSISDRYKQQIKDTDFHRLSSKLTTAINKIVVPAANAALVKAGPIVVVPATVAKFISKPELVRDPNALIIAANANLPYDTI